MAGGDWRQRAVAGQPFRPAARAHNDFLDAVTAAKRQRKIPGASRVPGKLPEGLVLVKNDSDDDANAFDVLGVDDILFGPADNLPEFQRNAVLSCVTPATPDHAGKFVVLYESIPAGTIGRAWAHGVCPVQVDFAGADDAFADVADGISTHLTSGPIGAAQVLWKESGTGVKWAIVRLGGGSGGEIPVNLVHNGGSQGVANVSRATYTYDVYLRNADLTNGTQIGMARPVLNTSPARIFYTEVTPATFGFAFTDADGALKIASCDEGIGTDCPT